MTARQHIFLGHASEDKARVRELYHQLKEEGFSPWLDEEDLRPGQNWRVEIPKAIESAAIFLACLSKTSIAKQGYVQREFRYALSAYANLPPDRIYLIPVRLDDCEVPDLRLPELGINLRDLHWVDLCDDRGFERLVTTVRDNVGTLNNDCSTSVLLSEIRQDFEVFRSIDAAWCPEMVMIPAGRFLMGSPIGEAERCEDEGPQHKVTISRRFALGRFAVTFKEFDYFCDSTRRAIPSDNGWGRGRRPVTNVSHHDALAYCAWLSGMTGLRYQLPTEAMWEYACRAGTVTPFSFAGNVSTDQVNYDGNYPYTDGIEGEYREQTVAVGTLPANPWGLYEMHGNIWEWCADWHGTYSSEAVTDPQGPEGGTDRVVRGGSWSHIARNARSAYRYRYEPDERFTSLGFRCAEVQSL